MARDASSVMLNRGCATDADTRSSMFETLTIGSAGSIEAISSSRRESPPCDPRRSPARSASPSAELVRDDAGLRQRLRYIVFDVRDDADNLQVAGHRILTSRPIDRCRRRIASRSTR